MSLLEVTYLDLLHEVCLQRGYALLLIAQHTPPAFSQPPKTQLRTLSVVNAPTGILPRRQRLQSGERVARCQLDTVDGDLEAAAELLVQLLTRKPAEAA